MVIEYGKNLTELEHDSDITEVYTDLLPYAVISAEDGSETVVTLTEVLLPIADTTLSQRKTLIRDFTDSFGEEEAITEDALRTKAQTYLENNPLGVEVPALTVSFEPLWKQPEYAAVLERVSLCDTVTIRHSALGHHRQGKGHHHGLRHSGGKVCVHHPGQRQGQSAEQRLGRTGQRGGSGGEGRSFPGADELRHPERHRPHYRPDGRLCGAAHRQRDRPSLRAVDS